MVDKSLWHRRVGIQASPLVVDMQFELSPLTSVDFLKILFHYDQICGF